MVLLRQGSKLSRIENKESTVTLSKKLSKLVSLFLALSQICARPLPYQFKDISPTVNYETVKAGISGKIFKLLPVIYPGSSSVIAERPLSGRDLHSALSV